MILINSSEAEGTVYVETKNLDGETNLKTKQVAKELIVPFNHEASFGQISGTLNIEGPNNRIYKFDGNFDLQGTHFENSGSLMMSVSSVKSTADYVNPITNKSVALRGMSLKNTEYVTGVVVYTGHDSKI